MTDPLIVALSLLVIALVVGFFALARENKRLKMEKEKLKKQQRPKPDLSFLYGDNQ